MSTITDEDRKAAKEFRTNYFEGWNDGSPTERRLVEELAQAIADARERENKACEAVADEGVCAEVCGHDACEEARTIRTSIASRRGK